MTTLSKYLTLLRQEVRSGCSTPHTGSPQSTLESTTADCREELLRDKLWAKADRDMSGPVGNQKQDQAQGSGQATRTSTGTGTYLLLVHSAMWETGRGTRTRQNPMETLSATHPDTFHLSLFLFSLCLSSHFRPAATALLRCFCFSPHPSTVHLHSTPQIHRRPVLVLCCTVLYCTA